MSTLFGTVTGYIVMDWYFDCQKRDPPQGDREVVWDHDHEVDWVKI